MTSTDKFTTYPLADKVALVTGAGRGIGRKCAEFLVNSGAKVIVVARTSANIMAFAETYPEKVEAWQFDITSDSFYARIEQLNKLDILVNNAGTNRPQPFAEVSSTALTEMTELNIHATFRTAQAAARVMLKTKTKGSIINISSQMGHIGSPNRSVYCMTKHAIEGLTKAIAVELAPHGIRVNSIAPTFIETAMTRPMFEDSEFRQFVLDRIPLGHVGQEEDVANAVLFLASPASAMITGDSLKVDGGWTAQ